MINRKRRFDVLAAVLLWLTFAGVAAAQLGSGGNYGMIELFAPGAASSSIIPTPTDTHTLGASGSTWAGLRLGAGTQLTAPTDGNLLLRNAAGTDAGLLQFGGTTSAFGAIKRQGAGVMVVRADDGGLSFISASQFATGANAAVLSGSNLALRTAGAVNFSSTSSGGGAPDLGLTRDSAGVLRVTDGSTGVGNLLMGEFLQLGGTTSAFPAWFRRAAAIEAQLADGSAFANVNARQFVAPNSLGGTAGMILDGGVSVAGLRMRDILAVQWTSSDNGGGAADTSIRRGAAGIVQFGANAPGTAGVLETFESASAPAAPAANGVRIYAKEGDGTKTTLCALFQAGPEQCFATEDGGPMMTPMGEATYFDMTGTTVTIAGLSDGTTNMVQLGPASTFTNDHGFDNGGANDGTIRYIAATTKTFHVAATISGTPQNTNDVFVFGISKNDGASQCKVVGSASGTQFSSLHCMITLATNDTLNIYVGNTTAARNFTVKSLNLFAMGM